MRLRLIATLARLNPRDKVVVLGGTPFPLPAIVGVILALLAGAVQVVNAELPISARLHTYILVVDVFFAGVGITPLVGPAFRNALKLPDWAAQLVTALLAAVVMAINTISMDSTVKVVLATVVTVAAGLGFESTGTAMSTDERSLKHG